MIKLNYFERALASAYVKAGVLGTFLVNQNSQRDIDTNGGPTGTANNTGGVEGQNLQPSPVDDSPFFLGAATGNSSRDGNYRETNALAIIGVGGTTPLTRTSIFNLDISYVRSLQPVRTDLDVNQQGVLFLTGVTFEL